MTIDEELKIIADKNNGILLPKEVVEFAEDEKTLLHNEFEWDNTIAGFKFRLSQARNIIRLRVETIQHESQEIIVRSYVSLSTERGVNSYRKIKDVLNNEDQKNIMLSDAKRELESIRNKYKVLKELSSVWDNIDKILKVG